MWYISIHSMNNLNIVIKDQIFWAFNVNGIIEIEAISQVVRGLNKPVIMLISKNAIKFSGLDYLLGMIKVAKSRSSVPIFLQLDHGKDQNFILECAKKNFDLIMIDTSDMSFEDNIKYVKKISSLIKQINSDILIEAELGRIVDPLNTNISNNEAFTDPNLVEQYIKETQADLLAISVGNQHGFSQTKPFLNRKLLKKISKISNIPLVIHGGDWIRKEDLAYAINNGVKKINIGPELRVIIGETILRNVSTPSFDITDYRILMKEVSDSLLRYLKNKINFN